MILFVVILPDIVFHQMQYFEVYPVPHPRRAGLNFLYCQGWWIFYQLGQNLIRYR